MSRYAALQIKPRTGSPQQLASVRPITLNDGPSLGLRALAFSTGGGLDFWVLSDRCMDIGPLWLHGFPMAWVHPSGFPSPALHNAYSDGLSGIERTLSGFMVTCGLDNVRQPADGTPLHGTLPLTPARITGFGEQWDADVPLIFAEGEIVTAHLNRPSFKIRRRIEAPIGGRTLSVQDTIENIGPEAAEMRILYHTNLGFPLVQDGLTVQLTPGQSPILNIDSYADTHKTPPAECHKMTAEMAAGVLVLSPASTYAPEVRLNIDSDIETLPYTQIWSDQRPGRGILAIEPSNCRRNADGTSGAGVTIEPFASVSTRVTYRFSTSLFA